MAGDLSRVVLAAAFEVHSRLGPGLLESSYRRCLAQELRLRGFEFATEVPIPLEYRGITLEESFRADFVVGQSLLLELKAVERLARVHEAQLLTYLRLMRLPVGLLINFNVPSLRTGIRRLVNKQALKEHSVSFLNFV